MKRFKVAKLIALPLVGGLLALAAIAQDKANVAVVNGVTIPQSRMDFIVKSQAQQGQKDSPELRQQIKEDEGEGLLKPSTPNVEKRLQEIRKEYLGAEKAAAWQADLQQYGLREEDLARHIVLQACLERLIDARLRPTIHISHSSIESYYQQQLLPELRKAGVKDVPLVEVSPKIEELLTQRRMNELLASWLHDLRSQSDIRMGAAAEPGVSQR